MNFYKELLNQKENNNKKETEIGNSQKRNPKWPINI